MGDLYGTSIDINDVFFGELDDDTTIARQRVDLALDTPIGYLDEFPEYGFEMRGVILRGMTPTDVALLPLEVRTALEQEPSFVSAEVAVASQSTGPGPTVALSLACSITAASGDQVGFSVAVPQG